MAALFGMAPAPVQSARVLEIGCCEGGNLISMAMSIPGGEFVGIDLTAPDIERARETAAALQLSNIQFEVRDLTTLPGSLGQFDYVIAHGVYSWVPTEVREKLMAVVQASLAPNGVGYISYNAMPGCRFRILLREMMLFYTQGIGDPTEKIARARQVLQFMKDSRAGEKDQTIIREEAEILLNQPDYLLYHDELESEYHASYFHEFAEHASRCGLQYLAEATYFNMLPEVLGSAARPHFASAVAKLTNDPLQRQQYLDFAFCRHFRTSLVCHRDIQLDSVVRPQRLKSLSFYSPAAASGAEEDGEDIFIGFQDAKIKTGDPYVCAIMHHLIGAWPRSVAFHDLPGAASDPVRTSEILHALLNFGMLEVVVTGPQAFSLTPGDRPTASPLARLQAAQGKPLTNLRHIVVHPSEDLELRLIPLLDGTRTRADLLAENPTVLPSDLDAALNSLGGFCLLTQ
jgi:hypothetical protein